MSGSDDTDGYQFGTPVVSGSDNFTIAPPPGCDNALHDTQLVVTDSGFAFGNGTIIGATGCIYMSSGSRITLTNRAPASVNITVTQAIFGFSSAIIQPNGSLTFSVTWVSIVQGGSITSTMSGSSNRNVLDVVDCPVPIDEHPFC